MAAKYAAAPPFVECGGIANPTIANYQRTADAMQVLREKAAAGERVTEAEVRAAQLVRYERTPMPLSFLGEYQLEDPSYGGLPIETLHQKYPRTIGTAILLSVLEHVANPFEAARQLHAAMVPGGLVIVSVPWAFPTHEHGHEDNFRFSPSGLRHVFDSRWWDVSEADWRL